MITPRLHTPLMTSYLFPPSLLLVVRVLQCVRKTLLLGKYVHLTHKHLFPKILLTGARSANPDTPGKTVVKTAEKEEQRLTDRSFHVHAAPR